MTLIQTRVEMTGEVLTCDQSNAVSAHVELLWMRFCRLIMHLHNLDSFDLVPGRSSCCTKDVLSFENTMAFQDDVEQQCQDDVVVSRC